MVFSLTWLPEILERAGLKVAETPGWRTRGNGPLGTVRGVMCHHTASGARGNMPSLNLLINGRPASGATTALSGPLCQLGLGRDGTWYVVAAGRANHAGSGRWEGITTGNTSFIGIEAENNGTTEDWPPVQIDSYQRGVAAILKQINAGANMCCGHKEYAPHRKIDPDFDMAGFRARVADLLAGKSPLPVIAARDDGGRPTLRRGIVDDDTRQGIGDAVKQAQKILGLPETGTFDADMEATVRQVQRDHALVPDGIIGPKSWRVLTSPDFAVAPEAPTDAAAAPLGLADAAPAPVPTPPAAVAVPPIVIPPVGNATLQGVKAIGPDGKSFATLINGRGFGTIGLTTIGAWLSGLASPPQSSASELRVIKAISVNEGRLEAVNSYDNAHMSVGIFQWTAGPGDDPGELAVLLQRLKIADRAAFDDCFGQFGIDVQAAQGAVTGLLLLKGKQLKTSAQKDVLRDVNWAYRFWRAGFHPSVRACQFGLAVSRIGRFLTTSTMGRPLNEWLSSEVGIALILDEHVNRPGHVPSTLEQAIRGLRTPDPAGWADDDEHKLIQAYIEARSHTNMTASTQRAAKILDFVHGGRLSDKRGSFVPG